MHLRILLVLISLAVALPAMAFDHLHNRWNELVQKHVYWLPGEFASEVDYAGFQQDEPALNAYLADLEAVTLLDYQQWQPSQQLAFLINAYNAYTVQLILTRYPDLSSIKELGSFFRSPWKSDFITLFQQPTSLDDIEHGMIRQQFDEPRIHFAVVCASIGCPALTNQSFTAPGLEQQLDRAVRRFLSDKTRNYFNPSANTLYLSKLFDWYADDFKTNNNSVNDYLRDYASELGASDEQVVSARIQFLEYDWALNAYN